MKVLAVIPAHLKSTRIPRKLLLPGRRSASIIVDTIKAAKACNFDKVVVATPDIEIADAAIAHGAECYRTSGDHRNGTERTCEAVAGLQNRGWQYDVVVNWQAEWPTITDHIIAACLLETGFGIWTPVSRGGPDWPEVKVVKSFDNRALYFTRNALVGTDPVYRHLGIYLFKPDVLLKYRTMAPGLLERSERLEQLRWLEHGFLVGAVPVEAGPDIFGIDEHLAYETYRDSRTNQTRWSG